MLVFLGAFIAGMMTVLAPCVLPLLPVIIGGSVSGNMHDRRRPYIITASLAISLFIFTLFFKATTLFIAIPTIVIMAVSGGIIIAVGVAMLFPALYERLILAFNLQAKSQRLLGSGVDKKGAIGAIITGAALGPVFSSCSPVYLYILAFVLPVNFGIALVYLVVYILGLAGTLLLIGLVGQKFIRHMRWAANPRGWFTRTMAVIFIIVGLMVITGYDKRLQTYVAENTPFDFDGLSSQLIPR
jgi:cytochrome c-type biogenesis protein